MMSWTQGTPPNIISHLSDNKNLKNPRSLLCKNQKIFLIYILYYIHITGYLTNETILTGERIFQHLP